MAEEKVVIVAGSEERPAPKRKARMIEIKIIKDEQGVALLEWRENGRAWRGYLPTALVNEGQVEEAELASAAPYGLPWEELIPRLDAREVLPLWLRNEGIWTEADLLRGDPRAPFRRFAEELYGQFIKKVKEQ